MTTSIPNNRLSVAWINGLTVRSPEWLVSLSERIYRTQIDVTAEHILSQKGISVLLVSGPSASTKTTTAAKLSERLRKRGVESVVLSLDNFFVNRCDIPPEPDGTIDFESIKTLDLPTLYECIETLLKKREAEFPVFNFKTGLREKETQHVSVRKGTLLIVEGIHALNPAVVQGHDPTSFRKIYISPDSDYYLDNKLVLSARQVRLIRRMVRDYYHRGNSVGRTFDMWTGVVSSELVNILPFRAEADYIIDSTIRYEPNIYSAYLDRILDEDPVEERYERQLLPLKEALSRFLPLTEEYVPASTVLHEFLPH